MHTKIINNDDYTQIDTSGRIDASTVLAFENEAIPCIDKCAPILIINLKDVEYISSAGLRAILKIAKITKEKNISLACVSLQTAVFDVFRISGFNSIVKIFDDTNEALASLMG